MKIFASWSGDESRQIAEILREWIPNIIQDVEVYVSSRDITKGERWLLNVGNNLEQIDFGVVVVTKKNLTAPWIMFEAGALSKSVKGRLIPILCGIAEIETANSPLKQFQYIQVTEAEMLDMLKTINSQTPNPIDQNRLTRTFEKFWPDFLTAYEGVDLSDAKPVKEETQSVKLTNIENAISEIMIEMRHLRSKSPQLPNHLNRYLKNNDALDNDTLLTWLNLVNEKLGDKESPSQASILLQEFRDHEAKKKKPT